ncbi:DNA-binding protein [Burkholderia pseudomallei]|uniref:DNA-binding protein n=2 Tax=Burkholderia pseudomallei TaxID=28450 RepID=UPI00201AABEB|nr:DNA-binding protein [Burkholderia pseudomallei]MCL4671256.1 DNA-binding protein [Burkholderia pseudomallei]
MLDKNNARPSSVSSKSRPFQHKSRTTLKQHLRSDANVAERHRASQSNANDAGLERLGHLPDLLFARASAEEATKMLAGLIVRCIDANHLQSVDELIRHPSFGSAMLQAVVQYARRDTVAALYQQIDELQEQVKAVEDASAFRVATARAEERERQRQAKKRTSAKIGPAQQKRLAHAKKNKILDELTRRARSGEDFMGRSISSELATRFNVSSAHVRELRKKWLSVSKPEKRN